MGASCTTNKDASVQGPLQLTQEAKSHLKQLKADGQTSTISKDKLQKLLHKGAESKDGNVEDLDKQLSGLSQEGKNQKLWEAIEQNEIRMVEVLLGNYDEQQQQLSDADLYDQGGQSMVHKAASLGHAEIVMLLLERTGAKPDLVNSQLATPLHLACKNNRESVARFLIGCGVDVNVQDEHGQTPLLICCIHGHYDLAQLLVESSVAGHTPEPLEVDNRDHRGLTPLNCAAIKGDLKLTRLLIEKGNANVEEASPKGCSPLLYAARGGYDQVVRYLLEKGASALKQDNAGGTVLHHAIEKSHLGVLQVLLEHGVDVYSAIEIADNAGRTPLFEALDSNVEAEIVSFLTRKRGKGGFGAQVNVINYNGQSPLFSAVREQNLDNIKVLVEQNGAVVDLTGGEVQKDDGENSGEQYDSVEEKFFMEAFNNTMTPLQLACVLGADNIMHYLLEHGANPNIQSHIKGYSCLHLAVLANKPEIIIDLLNSTNEGGIADPFLADYSGRSLLEMVHLFIPSYLNTFTRLVESLQIDQQAEGNKSGIVVATHYYNPDDDRQIQGLKDPSQISEYYKHGNESSSNKQQNQDDEGKGGENSNYNENDAQMTPRGTVNSSVNPSKKFMEMGDTDIEVEEGRIFEKEVENVFGRKIALGLIALNWKIKEVSMKIIYKQAEKFLSKENQGDQQQSGHVIMDLVRACTVAIDVTCKEKVIKVLNITLQLLTLLLNSTKVESAQVIENFKNVFIERSIVLKLLQKSEEGNTRLTNKIHECLLDFSFHPKIGESHVSSLILQRIQAHNKATAVIQTHKVLIDDKDNNSESKQPETGDFENQGEVEEERISPGKGQKAAVNAATGMMESALGSFKGLLAQLALLYKFVNSFGVGPKKRGPLNVPDIVSSIVPSLQHQSQDIRTAATRILLDVHRLTGAIKEDMLVQAVTKQGGSNDKTLKLTLEKLGQVQIEKKGNKSGQQNDGEDYLDSSQSEMTNINPDSKNAVSIQSEARDIILEKGQSKDWQERELALKQMKDYFEAANKENNGKNNNQMKFDEAFLSTCTVLLHNCLEENNISVYLFAVDVAALFFQKAIFTEVVLESLQSLIKTIVLKTTDTNTRVRKKSVDLINLIWNMQQGLGSNTQTNKHNEEKSINSQNNGSQLRKDFAISTLIADVICDSTLQEKAIIGRLGLFVKKAQSIESEEELSKKPHQLILGKNYEQLIGFACQWCSHKNTKVRQNALKLIIEVCRLNSIDPRGSPFKQRIINFILGLRPSLRDPLVKKINEVCLQKGKQQTTENDEDDPSANKNQGEMYIDINELELNVATKSRATSLDIHNIKKAQANSKNDLTSGTGNSNLPDIISKGGVTLPQMTNQKMGMVQPTSVLPHAEPLTEEQKTKSAELIEIFSLELITCFYSQFWSARQAAIQKVDEQLHQLDPNRRDAMTAEINRKNQPIEDSYRLFIKFIEEGSHDPVLKNYISILELLQKALPIFFRYLQPQQIKKELMPLVGQVIKKTSDLKAKVREATINFCLYLSHQSPIGPEAMVQQVLTELESVYNQNVSNSGGHGAGGNVAVNLGNSHLIESCMKILAQYQTQAKILQDTKELNQAFFKSFMNIINMGLKHQNPQVRKESESLFKLLYLEFKEKLDSQLINQKPQITQKLLLECKQESGVASKQQAQEHNVQRAQTQIRTDALNQQSVIDLLKGQEENLQQLKLPNQKKRLKAIIEIKKAIQREMVVGGASSTQTSSGGRMSQQRARELFEPLTLLIRQLLQDDNAEIYLESLNMLKFVVASLAPYLSTLDLHLMMGSFIGIVVSNTLSSNMRIQIASDKVIIFFAKHNNIGPFIVAKDVLKNIEKIVKAVQTVGSGATKKEEQMAVLAEKKIIMMRFLGILQLLLQHFSIVLCYQSEFYDRCIELIADTMLISYEDQGIKNICVQIIVNLSAIDVKLLENAVSKVDVARKTPLRKAMIELEHQQRQGKNVITQDHHAFVSQINPSQSLVNESPSVDTAAAKLTRESQVSSSRTSLFSPGSTMRATSNGGFGVSQYEWSKQSIDAINNGNQQPVNENRGRRRMISLESDSRLGASGSTTPAIGNSMQSRQQKNSSTGFTLPEIAPVQASATTYNQKFGGTMTNAALNSTIGGTGSGALTSKMSLTSTCGAGFSSNANYGGRVGLQMGGGSISNEQSSLIGNRPPLYVPTKREQPTSLLNSQQWPQQNQVPIIAKQNSETYKPDFNRMGSMGGSNAIITTKHSSGQLQQQPITGGGNPQRRITGGLASNITNTQQATNSIFNMPPPGFSFESGVKRYQDSTPKEGAVPKNEF